jgi:predicted metalloprotease
MAARGREYRHAKLVLFTDATPTACGYGNAATGPFYCPGDEHVYIDLGFFQTLSSQLGAKGEFARAYVVAHEIGHHVQNILGTEAMAHKGTLKGASGNSVRLELQADCYAGVWAHSAQARNLLETGDIESAIGAAARIGDDVLQREETGRVRPESFTHGTAAQRQHWLTRGFNTGDIAQCDTFSAGAL